MQTIGVVAFALILSIVAGPCTACSPPMFWEPQGFLQRMQQAPIVFRGKVTSLHNKPESWYGLYKATFEVDCVYKSGGGALSESVRVAEFGYDGGRCSSTDVEQGESYIVLADAQYGEGLRAYSVNIQSAAKKATASLITRVERDYKCNQPGA